MRHKNEKHLTKEAVFEKLFKYFDNGIFIKRTILEDLRKNGYSLQTSLVRDMYAEAHAKWSKMKEEAYIGSIASEKLQALEEAVMKPLERRVFLSKLIRGEILVEETISHGENFSIEKMPAKFNQRISAIAELNKMGGDYAPTKNRIVDENENDLKFNITLNL
jgi:hypothetical protein